MDFGKLIEIVLFVLGVIGMTHIMVDGKIMEWLRNLADKFLPEKLSSMFHCYQCMGFWCGIFCSWAAFKDLSLGQTFVGGCAGSFLATLAATYLNYLEALTVVNLPDDTDEGK